MWVANNVYSFKNNFDITNGIENEVYAVLESRHSIVVKSRILEHQRFPDIVLKYLKK